MGLIAKLNEIKEQIDSCSSGNDDEDNQCENLDQPSEAPSR